MKRLAPVLLVGLLAACSTSPDLGGAAGVDPDCPAATRPVGGTGPAAELFGPAGPVQSLLTKRLHLHRADVAFPADLDDAASLDSGPASLACLRRRPLDVPGWAEARAQALAAGVTADAPPAGVGGLHAALAGLVGLDDLDRATPAPAPGAVPGAKAARLRDPAGPHPLLGAFEEVFAVRTPWPHRGPASPLGADGRAAIADLAARVGPQTERALARVVAAMAFAERARLAAVARWYPDGVDHADLARVIADRAVAPERMVTFDHAAMARAGLAVARAVETLAARLADHPLPGVAFHLATPLGEVAVSGTPTDDTYRFAAPALVVDQAGNDTYEGVVAAPADESVPLSALIDLGGDDHYLGTGAPATQGAGVVSFGFLVDRSGDDTYEATDLAQGAALLGVGALLDGGGHDTYRAHYYAQGAGESGLGLALDLGGDDTWALTSYGQGYASARGGGLLLDLAGNDSYVADDTAVTNPAVSQTKDHNVSLAQGAATGIRAASVGGGTGMLVDVAGDDAYACAVFCQGSGYWFAQGVLYDGAGNDTYHGVYYTQGAAAHFAFGTLLDESGNDHYDAVMNVSEGAGHDLSAGFLVDGTGDDVYGLTHLSHGAANDVGLGVFADGAGDDVYGSSVPTEGAWFGQTASEDLSASRAGRRSLGLFLDRGGTDDYRVTVPGVADNAVWRLPGVGWAPAAQQGLGADIG